ncbi:uncharacterized protein B0H18DRAFT_978480 [Fomitopsis serialis]|uniref:uncharacterized protein n=1 Tax=Fomitopsis serialis TaxID=139415 RepID=UPI002008A199|nr:uncharacterized protein B0H18DRAFT_978480 [Neoantrodia serialis]KAH9934828.1 hypothetical protein B0H18DRAFT_978480 [Neoantrodia serialis]
MTKPSKTTATVTYDGTRYDLPLPCTVDWGKQATTFTAVPSWWQSTGSPLQSTWLTFCQAHAVTDTGLPSSSLTSPGEPTSTPAGTGVPSTTSDTNPTTPSESQNTSNSHAASRSLDTTFPSDSFSAGQIATDNAFSLGLPSATIPSLRSSSQSGSTDPLWTETELQTQRPTASTISSSMGGPPASVAEQSSASLSSHASTAAIAGGVVGGILCLLLLLSSLFWFRRRQHRRKLPPSAEFMGVVRTPTPGPFTTRLAIVRDSSYEPVEPPPAFTSGAYSDQVYEKAVGDQKERLEGEDDAEESVDGSATLRSESADLHWKTVGEAI